MKIKKNSTAKPVPLTLVEYVEKNLEELTIKAAELGEDREKTYNIYRFAETEYQQYLKNSTSKPVPTYQNQENK